MVIRVLKKRQFRMVISLVKKRLFFVVRRRGCFVWLLVWLK